MKDPTLHYQFDPDHSRMPKDMKYNERLEMLVSGGCDGRVNLFKLESGKMTRISTAKDFNAPVTCVQWQPMGQRIACCSQDGNFIIYKIIKHDLIVEFRRQGVQPLTSLSWCQQQGQSIVAMSGTSKDIILVIRQLNEWNCEGITTPVQVLQSNTFPSFVCWSPVSQDKSYLLYGQYDTIVIWQHIQKGKSAFKEVSRHKIELSRDYFDNCIRDVSWQPTIGNNIFNPIVLLADRIVFFQGIKINRLQSQTIELTKGQDNFTLKMGWSDNGIRLNINCLENQTFTIKTVKCSFDGVWKMVTQ